MDIEITTGNCTNCKGVESCNKYCMMHAGKALIDFLSRVDMVETRIGEYSSSRRNGPIDLIVSGHQLHDLENPSWILTSTNVTLDASNKFSNVFGSTPTQLINNYCNKTGVPAEEQKDIINKLTKLNKNKLLILPFKPHTPCSIDIDNNGVKDKKRSAKIFYLKWETDKETYKLKCTLAFELDNEPSAKLQKMSITEYISNFRLSSMEMQAKTANQDDKLISITDSGIIKPIVIKEGNVSVAVDGNFVYQIVNSDTRVVGYWNESDALVINVDTKSKPYKKLLDNINFIKLHKRYIAPYMLFEPNTVEIK